MISHKTEHSHFTR